MRVLVCGGREFDDYDHLERVLDALHHVTPIVHLCHGGARGADRLSGIWAARNHVPCREIHAEWGKYNRSAGAIRNQRMLTEFRPDLVVAFPGGRGTADMVMRSRKARVNVMEATP